MAKASGALRRRVEAVAAICAQCGDDRSLRARLLEELGREAAFDYHVWLLTDPATTVGSSPLASVPSSARVPQLIRARYLSPANRWSALDGVSTLRATSDGGGDPWHAELAIHRIGDVASLAFRDEYGFWAFLDLWRSGARSRFAAEEVDRLRALLDPITEGLRRTLAETFARAPSTAGRSGPAVLVLAPQFDVRDQTADAAAHLRTLVPRDDGGPPVPAGAYNVAAQLLAVEAGIDEHPPSARVHLAEGTWVTLRAARVEGAAAPSERDIAVSIETCSPAERRGLYASTHGLTARETELVDRLALGADTRTLAAHLHLSEHTVQDHLKAIFAKTRTRNRRTLLTRIAGA